ncbi:MBL fold metallo-hydrolase [Flavobacterium sediminilitoris]|uniref:MBL fold metallo-hydrolase n=1 Tax=Flavobacterium sediminilitoris TaxID=2024526 RepID=A0ABY4HNB7_9FLAO|nr:MULTISPECIES: rhodanese-like domain-containing protein [Flavobacterium]UOX33742.1 MBL fold metallo-hydrolase [Flavobacterium sediminilitoris]
MKIEQIYTGCIAHAAYYIENNGEAAIFDPLREVQPYINRSEKDKAKIKYIFETHFHADFVSGHLDLAQKTGANIVYGPTANPNFEAIIATDNQEFKVGNYTIRAIHTPGHTLESTCYLLIDENGKQHGIITGDTLFIGDVGRPDLAQKLVADLTQDKLAEYLFHSLRDKIMPLSDDLIVYPNHGAGSACGKNMSKETTDTLGNQKKTNYALRANMTIDDFKKELLDGLLPPPAYFPQNVLMNIQGYESLDSIKEKADNPLSPQDFEAIANQTEALILDVRHETDFVKAHIPNSIFIGLHGQFAPWVGALVRDVKQPILLITPEGQEEETVTRLSRVGFDNTLGYLKGGIDSWVKAGYETDSIYSVSPEEFEKSFETTPIIDCRRPGEYSSLHINRATNIPLDFLNDHLSEIPKNEPFYVHCAGGYRSVIWSSIMKSRGYHNMINIETGMSGIKNTAIPLVEGVCPSTLK